LDVRDCQRDSKPVSADPLTVRIDPERQPCFVTDMIRAQTGSHARRAFAVSAG
jgi:hypothetical protein